MPLCVHPVNAKVLLGYRNRKELTGLATTRVEYNKHENLRIAEHDKGIAQVFDTLSNPQDKHS